MTAPSSQNEIPPPSPGALTYNGYLKVDELKLLQVCMSDPAHHDEPLFIIIHQSYELWFKLILHEIDEVFRQLDQDRIRRAIFYMRRILAIMKLLVQQIHILETMQPKDFLGFRYSLSPASGFGSSQFREIEFATGLKSESLLEHFKSDDVFEHLKARYDAPSLLDAFYTTLRRRGFKLPQGAKEGPEANEQERIRLEELAVVYTDEDNHGDVHDLAECLLEFDELLFLWRSNHVIVVERMIGFKRGTGGSDGVGYLQSTLAKRCFPDLWNVRTVLEQPAGMADSCPFNEEAASTKPTAPPSCPFHSDK